MTKFQNTRYTAHPKALIIKHIVSFNVKNRQRQGHTFTTCSYSIDAPTTDGNGTALLLGSSPLSLFFCLRIMFCTRNGMRGCFSYESKLNTEAVSSSSPAKMPMFAAVAVEVLGSGFSTEEGRSSPCWFSKPPRKPPDPWKPRIYDPISRNVRFSS